MARQGLPKKYAKMGFKKGWAAYKKAKRSRGSSTTRKKTMSGYSQSPRARVTRKTTTRKTVSRPVSRRTAPLMGAVKIPKIRTVARKTPQKVLDGLIAVMGGIGSSMVAQQVPGDQLIKSVVQMAAGIIASASAPANNRLIQNAATGAIVSGSISAYKALMPDGPEVLAGQCSPSLMGVNMVQRNKRLRPSMGINMQMVPSSEYQAPPAPSMNGTGYGPRYVTSGDLI